MLIQVLRYANSPNYYWCLSLYKLTSEVPWMTWWWYITIRAIRNFCRCLLRVRISVALRDNSSYKSISFFDWSSDILRCSSWRAYKRLTYSDSYAIMCEGLKIVVNALYVLLSFISTVTR